MSLERESYADVACSGGRAASFAHRPPAALAAPPAARTPLFFRRCRALSLLLTKRAPSQLGDTHTLSLTRAPPSCIFPSPLIPTRFRHKNRPRARDETLFPCRSRKRCALSSPSSARRRWLPPARCGRAGAPSRPSSPQPSPRPAPRAPAGAFCSLLSLSRSSLSPLFLPFQKTHALPRAPSPTLLPNRSPMVSDDDEALAPRANLAKGGGKARAGGGSSKVRSCHHHHLSCLAPRL